MVWLEIGEVIGSWQFWLLWLFFHLLSWAYNALIDRLHWREHMDNWTWLTVVIGVAYTLVAAGVALWGWVGHGTTAVVVVFIMFVGTGIPMIAGDIRRVVAWASNGHEALGEVDNDEQAADKLDAEIPE